MKQLIINNILTDYDANEQGQIYSHKTDKFLTGYVDGTGYKMVLLTVDGVKKNYLVHRLIAQAFIPNPNNLPIVNHKDGNKLNNAVDNLEWVTQSENRIHAVKTGISNLAYGKRNKSQIDINDTSFWRQYLDTNYYVSKDGQVWNSKTGILLKQTPNQSGYIRYILRINNKNVSKQAHILVMEVWSGKEIISGQVVNHIDGDKTNNNLSNLEIISKQDNMLHACYVLKKNVKSVIQDLNGEIIIYPSLSQAARDNNVTPSAINYAIKNNSKCCNSYWRYK